MSRAAAQLYVRAQGAGPLFVWSHGFGGSARNFGPQLRALRDRFRVASYDLRGHARSRAVGEGGFAMSQLVADLGRVIDGLRRATGSDEREDRPAILGGLSLGAAVSLHFALAHPERVRALVLASLPAGSAATGSLSSQAEAFAAALEAGGLEEAGERFVWGARSGLDERGAALVRQGFLEHSAAALAAILRETLRDLPGPAEIAPRLAATRLPVLVIAGAGDAPSLVASRELVAAVPGARLVEIPQAGHIVNLEAPAAFNAAVEELVTRLEDAGRAQCESSARSCS